MWYFFVGTYTQQCGFLGFPICVSASQTQLLRLAARFSPHFSTSSREKPKTPSSTASLICTMKSMPAQFFRAAVTASMKCRAVLAEAAEKMAFAITYACLMVSVHTQPGSSSVIHAAGLALHTASPASRSNASCSAVQVASVLADSWPESDMYQPGISESYCSPVPCPLGKAPGGTIGVVCRSRMSSTSARDCLMDLSRFGYVVAVEDRGYRLAGNYAGVQARRCRGSSAGASA